MRFRQPALVVLAMTSAPTLALRAQAPSVNPVCERLMPAALVGHLAKQPKTALIPRQPRIGAGGDCNYVADPGAPQPQLLLLADVSEVATHQDYLRYVGPTAKDPVPGLGDESNAVKTIVAARKGKLLVVVSSFSALDPTTMQATPYLTRDQLIELVRHALSRE